jgi:N-acetylneuraminate synthase
MAEMRAAFPDVVFGLSDHTTNNYAAIAAVALGASIIERHFTDTMDRTGPDIICSMDEAACAELIKASREVFAMRGGVKRAAAEEQVTIDFAFASLVSIRQIKKGDILSETNIWAKRPGTGELKAEDFYRLLGRRAAADIPKDTHISHEMVLNPRLNFECFKV